MENFEFNLPHFRPTERRLKILALILAGLLALFLLYQLFRFIINFPVLSALDQPQDFSPKQISRNKDLATVNSVIELPTDQNGTMAIIKDVKALSQKKDYFKKARNGDILIIYPDLTIIYDRENHTVVDIAKTNLLQ